MNTNPNREPGGPIRMTDAGGADRETILDALGEVVRRLEAHDIEHAIMGGIAVAALSRPRWTHDIDVFLRPDDAVRALDLLDDDGFEIERTDPMWLYKAERDGVVVDLIFRTEGEIYFDDAFADRTIQTSFEGVDLTIPSPEDLIVIKIAAHKEDCAYHWFDALALLASCRVDWDRLVEVSDRQARRVLSLLCYADSLDIAVPPSVIRQLARRRYDPAADVTAPPPRERRPRPDSGDHPSVTVAAVGDLHVGADDATAVDAVRGAIPDETAALLLAGDLTRRGLLAEYELLARGLEEIPVPVIAVLGNHDVETDQQDAGVRMLSEADVTVLRGEATVVDTGTLRVGVAGTTGFGGGFTGAEVADFGEPEMKAFAARSRRSATSLRRALDALDALDADLRVGLTHYSPARETLRGEPRELYPFLGSSLLARALDRGAADIAIHGHAHAGNMHGQTPGGVPVANVAQPVIRRPVARCEVVASHSSPGG